MPTSTGRSCCTLTGGTRHVADMKLGPDGPEWAALSAEEVRQLCDGSLTLRHVAKTNITHLCAGYGTWAFKVFDSSLPHGVVFLHIKPPAKLDAMMGGQMDGVYTYTGRQLLQSYAHADDSHRVPRVWRRAPVKAGSTGRQIMWDELAINFCLLTHLGAPLPSTR